jgi:diadenosine tetraphosphate (Ap4A) HIT family hydrolase
VGEVAGQTINHLHVHVIPRYAGDVDDPTGGVRSVVPHKANYLHDLKNAGPLTLRHKGPLICGRQ